MLAASLKLFIQEVLYIKILQCKFQQNRMSRSWVTWVIFRLQGNSKSQLSLNSWPSLNWGRRWWWWWWCCTVQTTSRTTSGIGTRRGWWWWWWVGQQTLLSLLESGTSRCTRLGMIWMFRFVASSTGRQQWAQLWATARNCTFHVVADTTVWRRNWARFSISLSVPLTRSLSLSLSFSLSDQLAVGLLPSSTCFQSAWAASASAASPSPSSCCFLLIYLCFFRFLLSRSLSLSHSVSFAYIALFHLNFLFIYS